MLLTLEETSGEEKQVGADEQGQADSFYNIWDRSKNEMYIANLTNGYLLMYDVIERQISHGYTKYLFPIYWQWLRKQDCHP